MIIVNPSTRQFNIPGADLVFGVTDDSGSVIKEFQCPRYVGNKLDLMSCFLRINYRNANGEVDSYLISDTAVDGDNIVFGWELSEKVTRYRGNISFVLCATGPDTKVKWHTTMGRGQVLEGLEPDTALVEEGTSDVVAALIAMVEAQTEAVAAEGTAQVKVVQNASKTAQNAAVAEIQAKGVNTLDSIPEDYTAMQNAVDDLARGRAGAIVCSVEGSAIAVNDASDNYIQGLKIFGRSTQDGTPTPEAPVEIKSIENLAVMVGGKNLLNTDAFKSSNMTGGFKADYEGDGIIHIYGSATTTDPTAHVVTELAIPIDPGKNYTFHTEFVEGAIEGAINMHTYLAVGDAPGSRTNWLAMKLDSTSPVGEVRHAVGRAVDFRADAKFITRFWVYVRFPAIGDTMDARIRVWVTATDAPEAYESFKPIQTVELSHPLPGIPVASGGNYTDENGQQWVCDEVDLERGVYVQRLVKHELSSKLLFSSWTNGEREIGIIIRGLKWDYYPRTEPIALCSHFEPDVNGSIREGQLGFRLLGDYPYIYLLHTEGIAMTADEWRAFFDAQIVAGTPITLVIKAESVTETPLSETEIAAYRALHSNYPNTTILNDAGAHMTVKYAADTKLYIDNKIAALVGNI